MKRLLIATFTLTIFFAASAIVQAGPKTPKGALTGLVLDAAGKPVAGAVITYQSGGGDTPHAVHSDANGRFTISKLRWDNYDLRASVHGQYSNWEKNIMVRSGQQKSVTLRLTNGKELRQASTPKDK